MPRRIWVTTTRLRVPGGPTVPGIVQESGLEYWSDYIARCTQALARRQAC